MARILYKQTRALCVGSHLPYKIKSQIFVHPKDVEVSAWSIRHNFFEISNMRILQGKPIKKMSVIGVILGAIGVYLLVSQKELITREYAIVGVLMIFVCMLSWGYGSLFVGTADLPKSSFVNTGYQMMTGGTMLIVLSGILSEPWISPTQWSSKVIWVMVLLIVFGSILAFTSFNFLLRKVSPEKVATSTYVNPIIALILGWYFLNEEITLQSIVAAIVLLTGVYFINTSKARSFRSADRKGY